MAVESTVLVMSNPSSITHVAALRRGVDIDDPSQSYQELFEQWLAREQWHLASEALPLLVGVAPESWAEHIESCGGDGAANQLIAMLSHDLKCPTDGLIAPVVLRHWARSNGVVLPPPLARLLDFVAQVLPAVPASPSAEQATTEQAERELVLGAALALVTRFPRQCRDANGFFDGALIADLILSQAARWFPLEPPQLGREEIATLLESHLT